MAIESISTIIVVVSVLFIFLVIFVSFIKTFITSRGEGENLSNFVKEILSSLGFSDVGNKEGFQRDFKGKIFYLSEAPISSEDYRVFRIKFAHDLGRSYYIPVYADKEDLSEIIGEENANYCFENQHCFGMDKKWFYLDVNYENFKKENNIEKLMDFLIECSEAVINKKVKGIN
mgnify:CR=1 FL=1